MPRWSSTSCSPSSRKKSAASSDGSRGRSVGEQPGGLAERRERDDRRHARREQRDEPPADARDQPERPLGADEQRGQVVAGVVLEQPGGAVDHAAVGEHRLQPGDAGAHGPVAQRAHPARVGGHQPAGGRAVAGAEVDGGIQARAARVRLQRGERDARPDVDLERAAVDLARARRAASARRRPRRRAGRLAPTIPVFPPCGTIAAPCSAQARTTATTSAVSAGRTTARARPEKRPVQSVS